jgi:formate C-acetyltransferase
MDVVETVELTYQQRLDTLRETKLKHTKEKQEIIGAMNYDDWAVILPPEEAREVTKAISGSGVEITDVLIKGVDIQSNHPSGGWFGPEIVGRNYRSLLEAHPVYIDPMSSLAGAYMVNFGSYRKVGWPEEIRYPRYEEHGRYKQGPAVGGQQHFCQDLAIGLNLGWGGLLKKIRHYRDLNAPKSAGFYAGLEHVVLGTQNWIQRTADAARAMAEKEENPQLKKNLEEIAEINQWLVTEAPRTFREACQWIAWFQMMARMFNGSGSLGRLDVLLQPYYERDMAAGILTEDEAIFHVACLYLKETGYIQLGGPDAEGNDVTSPVSYVCLEAAHRIRIPVNVGVSVGPKADPGLLRRGVEIMFEDRAGVPKFLGVENITSGFARNDIPPEIARQRAYSGCHWFALPGREYCLNDGPKVNLAAVFEVTFNEMMDNPSAEWSVAALWNRFVGHVQKAVDLLADGWDFHMNHMHEVFPELPLDLLCYGPIEKGLDASQPGGVEFVNYCVDGSALATVADSFAALEQRVEQERAFTWEQIKHYLDTDWTGPDGEAARLAMKNIHRYGYGGSRGDYWAVRIAKTFEEIVKAKPTPEGHNMIPGFFSWAGTIWMGELVGATPNGRHARAPISHGCNPDPGFRIDGAPTAMAAAIAAVNPGWGNSAPMQLELDPGIVRDEEGVENVVDLIRGHMDMGGTQVNLNILDKQKILAAHANPSAYPDLIVRVTGFSAYWASLSKEFRQLVVDRVIAEEH